MEKKIIIIVAILLLLCLFNMPYGYYEFVRFASSLSFAYLAYSSNQQKYNSELIIYIALAILFQPFVKFAFGRTIWNVLDVIVAVGLLLSLIKKSNIKQE
jgi:hypothetical protein